jgi:F0F1-type ATP synthase membrane subunit c/vacuolar-type H+-ATPase subunit K
MKDAQLREMRIMHLVLIAAILSYAYVAEVIINPTTELKPVLLKAFLVLALADIAIAFFVRRRILRKATEGLRRNSSDPSALAEWRKGNVLGMVMAVSVGLYGLALRFMGASRPVSVPFYVAAVILMILWRPRLEEGVSESNASPPPLG